MPRRKLSPQDLQGIRRLAARWGAPPTAAAGRSAKPALDLLADYQLTTEVRLFAS